jgi:probable phosphoglycerate mutase
VATLILVRHARTAETGSLLSGRKAGIPLSKQGVREARALGERLSSIPLAGIISSPMQRCLETVEAIRSTRGTSVSARPSVEIEERITEVDYGKWTGKELKVLAKDPLWSTVQRQPSAMQFPDGESLRAAATRATEAIREWDARFKDDDVWLAASHGDIIKAIVSEATGAPLDLFQRIAIDPASITVIRFGSERPTILRLNESAAGIESLFAPKEKRRSLFGRLRGDN